MEPATTVLGAYLRRVGVEDRCTEVLATVLRRSPGLVSAIAHHAGLPGADSYAIATQGRYYDPRDGGLVIIDLEIRALDDAGNRNWLLWSEHKVDAPLTARQLERETSALRDAAEGTPSRLIAVTVTSAGDHAREAATRLDVPMLRWIDIARLAERARSTSGSPEERCLLAEWLAFSQHDLGRNMEPLRPCDDAVIARMRQIEESLEELMHAAFAQGCAAVGAEGVRWADDELQADPIPGLDWLGASARPYAMLADENNSWLTRTAPAVALVVGAWVEDDDARALRGDPEMGERLAERDFELHDVDGRKGGWVEVARALTIVAGPPSMP